MIITHVFRIEFMTLLEWSSEKFQGKMAKLKKFVFPGKKISENLMNFILKKRAYVLILYGLTRSYY